MSNDSERKREKKGENSCGECSAHTHNEIPACFPDSLTYLLVRYLHELNLEQISGLNRAQLSCMFCFSAKDTSGEKIFCQADINAITEHVICVELLILIVVFSLLSFPMNQRWNWDSFPLHQWGSNTSRLLVPGFSFKLCYSCSVLSE